MLKRRTTKPSGSYLIRLGKVKGKNGILDALKHNKRELPSGSQAQINVDLTASNYCLAGDNSARFIASDAKIKMIKAGIEEPRKNCVMAVEVIFSLPIDRHSQDTKPFFTDCYEWALETFAGELLSFDIHLDESAPHAHAIIMPLIDGKMRGSDMVGSKGNLMRLINKFHTDVAKRYGLSRSDKTCLSDADKQTIEKLVLTRLKSDSAMQSSVWPCLRDAIHNDPIPYAQLLGINENAALSIRAVN